MRFLFTTIPGSGHFHPLVPTARALQNRGHDVAFAASPSFAPAIKTAGFAAHSAGPAWLEHLSDPVMQKIMAGEFFVDLIRMGMVEGVIRAAKATAPMLSSAAAANWAVSWRVPSSTCLWPPRLRPPPNSTSR